MKNKAFHKFEHDFWDGAAIHYDTGFGNITSQCVPYVLDYLDIKPGNSLLDIACGPGYAAMEAVKRKIKLMGVDFSTTMIDLATQLYPESHFQIADAQNLPFDNNKFDGACCNFGILHFPDPTQAIAEAARVLKSNARYCFVLWNSPDKSPGKAFIMDALKTHAVMDTNLPEGPPFFHYANAANSFPLLKNAGFINPIHREIKLTWAIKSAERYVLNYKDGGARVGAILRGQTPQIIDAITADVAKKLEPYKSGSAYAVPVSIVLTGGQKG